MALVLLDKRVVVYSDLVSEVAIDIHEFSHEERCHLLGFQLILAKLIDVNQRVGRLMRLRLASEGFAEDHIFDLHGHIDVAEAPPAVLLPVVDEGVIVATLGSPIVNQNSVQVIRDIAVLAEGRTHHVLLLLDLLLQ